MISTSSLKLLSFLNFPYSEMRNLGSTVRAPWTGGESRGKQDQWGRPGVGRGVEAGAHTHSASALMQHRDILRKELALARVPRVTSMLRSRSLVLKISSIWRGTWLRSWLI